MATMAVHISEQPGELSTGGRLLLGGWSDIGDAIGALAADIGKARDTRPRTRAAADTACACPHGAAPGECTCRASLTQIAGRMAVVVDAMIRFMPTTAAVVDARGGPEGRRALSSLMAQVLSAERVLRRIETHSGAFRDGCALAYIDSLDAAVRKLQAGVRAVNQVLHAREAGHDPQARVLST